MSAATPPRRLRLGMVGGGRGAFIGAAHRIAARLDDAYELVAGAFASDPERSRQSGADLGLDPARVYGSYAEMAAGEAARPDGIDVCAIVTPNHLHYPVAAAMLRAGIHVICDKPLTATLADAEALAAEVAAADRVFVLTHNYTGYPLVREARHLVASGALGRIRVVQVEYAQDWLATDLEATGNKQAEWRTDPARAGAGGSLGDIGTHAFNLVGFVTGLTLAEVAAETTSFVPGRRLDDDVHALLRFAGGAKGSLWASQVAVGNENGLALRVYGETGGLEWRQEDPNRMTVSTLGGTTRPGTTRIVTRGGSGQSPAAGLATRIPPGHPEGYLEGFANLYRDTAALIHARLAGRRSTDAPFLVPGIEDGLAGMRFIDACVRSARAGGAWTPVAGP